MASTATFVSNRVPIALGSCITKPYACSAVPIARMGRRNSSPLARPYYSRANDFNSAFSHEMTTIMSPKVTDFLHPSKISFHAPRIQEPKEIVFLGGAPGAGKGTNSTFISKLRGFDAPAIVVSDLLNTPACKLLKDQGVMVNDEFVFNQLLKELEKPIYRNGVVVDGFPRTAKQAQMLADHFSSDSPSSPQVSFVMLHIDEAASIKRQQDRGKEVVSLNKERVALNLAPLEVRSTDVHKDASKTRYAVFKEQLDAVMGLGRQFPLVVVDASSSLNMVRYNLASKLATLPSSQNTKPYLSLY